MNYPLLFSPENIGSLTIKNRLVMTSMGCGLANRDGTLNDTFIAYYEERAKGGAGLLFTEVACVNSIHGVRAERQIYVTDDSQMPGLTKFTDTMHRYDCRIFIQLLHPGVMTSCAVNGSQPLVSPSGIMSKYVRQPARALTVDEIHSLVQDYANSADLSKRSGFDGIEIHAAHHYLLHEFLSPYFNKRTDEYGGSFENRSRLLCEIVSAVRTRVGEDYPITVRISAEDYMGDESFHLEEMIKLSTILESLSVNAINVTVGGTENGRSHSLEPSTYEQGWRKHLPASIKKMVNIPVIGTTVIRDPAFAEKLLEDGVMDFIGMGRSFLADPEWPNKAFEGRDNEIRKCVSCLRCIDNIKCEKPIICSVNPECGSELSKKSLVTDGNCRLVVIAGAGPAGLEAARILSARNFKVKLLEKSSHIGGQVYLASGAPNKEKMNWFIEYQNTMLTKQGVEIITGTSADPDAILAMNPYAVIDATGSAPWRPQFIEGINGEKVTTPVEVLSGKVKFENENIIIVGSGLTGLETAEYLAETGNMITIIEMDDRIAPGASPVVVGEILRQLSIYNAVIMPNRKLLKIEADRIYYENTHTNETFVLPFDHVVISMGVRSCGKIGNELKDKLPRVYTIGDAASTSRIHEAVLAGYTTAINL